MYYDTWRMGKIILIHLSSPSHPPFPILPKELSTIVGYILWGVNRIIDEENLKLWEKLIASTEEQLRNWRETINLSPHYERIYKSWENFIDKQKEELSYFLRVYSK